MQQSYLKQTRYSKFYSLLNMHKVNYAKVFVALDTFCDYVPVLSTASNFVDLAILKLFFKIHDCIGSQIKMSSRNAYTRHISHKSKIRCLVGLVPLVNLTLLGYDAVKLAVKAINKCRHSKRNVQIPQNLHEAHTQLNFLVDNLLSIGDLLDQVAKDLKRPRPTINDIKAIENSLKTIEKAIEHYEGMLNLISEQLPDIKDTGEDFSSRDSSKILPATLLHQVSKTTFANYGNVMSQMRSVQVELRAPLIAPGDEMNYNAHKSGLEQLKKILADLQARFEKLKAANPPRRPAPQLPNKLKAAKSLKV